ncbi:MAG: Zinc/iron permease [Podila humilis]|nr:MAG: Zinc/iron permease [Podila humilis]
MDTTGGDSYRAWIFTLASALACVFGAGLIFIDIIVQKILGRDLQILQNHKFLAGSLGLGSGVMVFSSFYNLLPEAKEQLSSDLSIFRSHADAYVMLFFFCGVLLMSLIHWIMHRFDKGSNSPGIENSAGIEQFMQREQARNSVPGPTSSTPTRGLYNGARASTPTNFCSGCVQEETSDQDEDERYNDSEYVDDEVTSLLNNAFLQIGKTPSSHMGDPAHLCRHGARDGGDSEDDDESIEVVITDQKDKILQRTPEHESDLDLDLDDDMDGNAIATNGILHRRNSWSSMSTRSQKPFAPINKRKKAAGLKAKGRRRTKESQLDYTTDRRNHEHKHIPIHHHHCQRHHGAGVNSLSTYGAVAPPPTGPGPFHPTPRHMSPLGSHLRRTSFPRLNQKSSQPLIYSSHDNLDHAVTDDREHTDLTEIGIQTALTIAVHKFPEGLITFLSTTADPCLGLSVFMAISVHNLIEGYLIAFPLFVGLHSRTKAFALAAALGGLSQPLGAVLGWFILRKVASLGWQVSASGVIYALVAGMMASIVVNGMWPQAVKCVGRKKTKVVQLSFFGGIAVMGICQAVLGTKCDF